MLALPEYAQTRVFRSPLCHSFPSKLSVCMAHPSARCTSMDSTVVVYRVVGTGGGTGVMGTGVRYRVLGATPGTAPPVPLHRYCTTCTTTPCTPLQTTATPCTPLQTTATPCTTPLWHRHRDTCHCDTLPGYHTGLGSHEVTVDRGIAVVAVLSSISGIKFRRFKLT